MDSASLTVAASAALIAGLTGSFHCFLMCGPLACAGLSGGVRAGPVAAYQAARVLAYAAVGGTLGSVGGGAYFLLIGSKPVAPWFVAVALVVPALGLDKRLGKLPGLSKVASAMARKAAPLTPVARSAALGALTPLLPCGLLWGVFAAALVSGSSLNGSVMMGAFALGALPALLGAQLQLGLWKKLPSKVEFAMRRLLPLAAAAVVIWRATRPGGNCH